MADDPDIRLMDTEAEEVYSPDRKQTGADKKKLGIFAAIGVVMLAVIAGIYMMLGGGGVTKDEVRLMQTKLGSLEQKISALEKQQAALQARLPAEGAEAALTGKIDTIAQRVEALEKKPVAVVAEKPKATQKEKTAASPGKKTHTVQKGETIYGISKKFGLKPDDLRKLNHLGAEDTVKPGQKLVVSK